MNNYFKNTLILTFLFSGGFIPKQPSLKVDQVYITTAYPMQHSGHKHHPEVYEKTVETAYGVQPKPFSKAEIEVVRVPFKKPTPATTTITSTRKPTTATFEWLTDATPPPFKAVPETILVTGNRRIADFLEPDLVKNDLHIGEILVGHDMKEYNEPPSPAPEILSKPTSPLDTLLRLGGCNIYGEMYNVGDVIEELSDECSQCKCTEVGVQCNYNDCKK